MRIGVPKETKTLEGRVALVPAAAGDLVKRGHEVWIEKDAGVKSGFKDAQYEALGVKIAPDAAALYDKGELIVKVKEPRAMAPGIRNLGVPASLKRCAAIG